MSQKLPINNFQWIKDAPQFNEDFLSNYNAESAVKLMLMLSILKTYLKFIMIYHFQLNK